MLLLVAGIFGTVHLALAQNTPPPAPQDIKVAADLASSDNWLTAGLKAAVSSIATGFLYSGAWALNALTTKLFILAGYLIQMGLEANKSIAESPLVTAGWGIARDFTNLGFILAIIFIAFATMLRIDSYGIKKLFTRLVVVALLVNFTIAISGVILNASNTVTDYFITLSSNNTAGQTPIQGMVLNLASATNGQKLLKPILNEQGGASFELAPTAGFLQVFAGLAFSAIFMVAGVAVFAALAIMLFIRYFAISILIIVAPLAWLTFAIPPVAKYFRMWWTQMLRAAFFLPITMFFLYLTIIMATNETFSKAPNSINVIAGASTSGFTDTSQGGSFSDYARMLLTLSLMVGGLIAGERFGVAGAATGMAAAQGVKNWALKAPGAAGGATSRFSLRKLEQITQKVDPETGRVSSGVVSKGASLFAKLGMNSTASGLRGIATSSGKNVEEYTKDRGNWTKDMWVASATRYTRPLITMSTEEKAALAQGLAKTGGISEVPKETLENLLTSARKLGTAKSILEVRPDLAASEKEIGGILQKMKPKDFLDKVDADAIKDERVVRSLTDSQKEAILKKGDNVDEKLYRNYIEFIKKTIAALKASGKDPMDDPFVESIVTNPAIVESIAKNDRKYEFLKDISSKGVAKAAGQNPENTATDLDEGNIKILETMAQTKRDEIAKLMAAGDKAGADKALAELADIEIQLENAKKYRA